MRWDICQKCDMQHECRMYRSARVAMEDGNIEMTFKNTKTGDKKVMSFAEAFRKFGPPSNCRFILEQTIVKENISDA